MPKCPILEDRKALHVQQPPHCGSCWASFLWGPCQLPGNLSQMHRATLASGYLLSGAVLPMLPAPRQLVAELLFEGEQV